MNFKKPQRLQIGDSIAIVSPSWGGPSVFPYIYENGIKVLKEWGLKIVEYPTARANADYLRDNPEIRAKDINDAFANTDIKAIFATIGGDDSVRVLPYLNKEIISNNPKILMGYSDTTTLHVFCSLLGNVTFYGPSIMAGFSQMESMLDCKTHVKKFLFEPKKSYEYKAYEEYSEGYPDWSRQENLGKTKPFKHNDGWHWLQGNITSRGVLFGGCIEVLEMMKATDYWPTKDFWEGKIFFLETSEDKPPIQYIAQVLRNYGVIGIFDLINGLIFARARDYTDEEKRQLEETIINVVRNEFTNNDLPIVSNFDIGHTDPQLVLPLGVETEIDCKNKSMNLIEPWLL